MVLDWILPGASTWLLWVSICFTCYLNFPTVIGVSIFYNAACFTTKQTTKECFALLLYICFMKIICFSHSRDKIGLTGRTEKASGKMPIKAEKREKGDGKKSLRILKGLHCFSVVLVPHRTHEEFCNTHNKETVVGDTCRRIIKDNNEKKIYRNNCALLEVW